MKITANTPRKKQQNQRVITVILWISMCIVLVFVIRQVASSKPTQLNSTGAQLQTQKIERHVEDLNTETEELDARLDQLRFDDDIRALRDE